MFYLSHPIVLEVGPDERDKALVWLAKNYPTIDCVLVDADDGGAEIRVGDQDAAILNALADMLDRP